MALRSKSKAIFKESGYVPINYLNGPLVEGLGLRGLPTLPSVLRMEDDRLPRLGLMRNLLHG